MNQPFDPLEPLLEASRTQRVAQHRAIAHTKESNMSEPKPELDRRTTLILSPYRGKPAAYAVDDLNMQDDWSRRRNTEANVEYAIECCKDSVARGEAPFASHLLYPQFLDDNDPEQRKIGLTCERAWIEAAVSNGKQLLVAIYVDRGISDGMQETLEFLINDDLAHVEFRKLNQGESQ